jgi:hypothetical protein
MCKTAPIEHLLLATLRRFSLTIRQWGTIKDGYMPLDKLETATSQLHYGTLVIFTNDHSRMEQWIGAMPKDINLKRHDIEEKDMKFSWREAATALEILEFNGHIKETSKGTGLNMEERLISLTKEGLQAYNTEYYIKDRAKTRYENTLYTFGIAAIVAAFFSLIIALAAVGINWLQYKKNDDKVSRPELELLLRSKQMPPTQKSLYTTPTTKSPLKPIKADSCKPQR